jgi:hypothetical protein
MLPQGVFYLYGINWFGDDMIVRCRSNLGPYFESAYIVVLGLCAIALRFTFGYARACNNWLTQKRGKLCQPSIPMSSSSIWTSAHLASIF